MLLRNSLLNLFGFALPLVFAVFTIPYLIEMLGNERFGLLTLIWAVVSYFGLFDLGLGRALTLQLSRYLASNKDEESGELVWTVILFMAVLGVTAGFIMFQLAPLGLDYVESTVSNQEQIKAVLYLSCTLPFIVLTTGYRGVLESTGSFFIINSIRIPLGIFTFVGPFLVVMYWKADLGSIALVLFFGRIVGCIAYAVAAHKILPNLYFRPVFKTQQVKPLFKIGGWLTVSNIVSPLMGYVDRFMIGGLATASAVAYYAAPNEMITKLWIIPGAVTTVLFPHFASKLLGNIDHVRVTYFKAQLGLFSVMLPICLLIFSFSYELLSIWVGNIFAEESHVILKLFSVGILINCMAHIPYTLIQSAGNTRCTALIHLFQLPIFVALLYWFIVNYGGEGAAIAWCLRMLVDAILMHYYGLKTIKLNISSVYLKAIGWLIACSTLFILVSLNGYGVKIILSILSICFSVFVLFMLYREKNMVLKV